jgi:hypothetical protein
MKTKLKKTTADVASPVSIEQAPQTFDPMNTNACPAVLDDRWQD